MTTKRGGDWIICQKAVKNLNWKMVKKRIKRDRIAEKKLVDEKYNKLNKVIKKKLNARENNKQTIYELTLKEMERIRDNNIHLKNYSQMFMEYKCNGIWETE